MLTVGAVLSLDCIVDEFRVSTKKKKQAENEDGDWEEVKQLFCKRSRVEPLHARLLCDPTSGNYLEWKRSTIKQARVELQQSKKNH